MLMFTDGYGFTEKILCCIITIFHATKLRNSYKLATFLWDSYYLFQNLSMQLFSAGKLAKQM